MYVRVCYFFFWTKLKVGVMGWGDGPSQLAVSRSGGWLSL